MYFLKYLIFSVLAVFSIEDGWVPIEKVPKTRKQMEERDASIWILFSKNLGAERILARFPEDPTYRYTESGDLEITSEREGERFTLTVQKTGQPRTDLLYSFEGKWIHEHFVQSAHHLFHFKTLSDRIDSPNHRQFISSFLIEGNG